ncbi:MAG: bacillithiol biosynthesis cysteine-adding enzyme BshC [Bacteroidetes bacterium]|nr:bacillithiol biosynthesis cysteine-adding enzyme BshC [Bacteroidota bacterium]
MQTQEFPLAALKSFHPLAKKYLTDADSLAKYFAFPATLAGLEMAIESRKNFKVNRNLLHERLKGWYAKVDKDFFTNQANEKVKTNVDLLLDENTFTITTGHQLSIFTGPLFFHYKILSAIKYAQLLKANLPQYNFVPVYWMASEDHDFEEIKSINLFGRTISWERESGGAVGRMSTEGLTKVVEEINALFANREDYKALGEIFTEAYTKGRNLADATTYLVNALFKEYGLVIIQPDDAELKKELIPIMKDEILNQTLYPIIKKAKEALEEYAPPVTPREINFFYLEENKRNRITKEGEFFIAGDAKKWSSAEIEKEIESHPENFSPNVVVRPMYQEKILPNLAYIGGNNEVAYWFELKDGFAATNTFYPQVLVRDSALILGRKFLKDLESLKLFVEDILLGYDDLEVKFFNQNELNLPVEESIETLFAKLEEIKTTAQSLPKDQLIPIVKQANASTEEWKKLKKEIKKWREKESEVGLEKLKKLYASVYPESSFQERHDNFIPYYLNHPNMFFDGLFEGFNPLSGTLKILSDK